MHEKIQRFSLRKLSVGLASVAIGTCIFSANAETAKADVTSDQTTQTTNVQGQTAIAQPQSNEVQNEKQQTSSAQNSVAEQSQKNLLDDLGKQKTSAQSGDQAEVKNQENRLVDQINYKLTNNASIDNKEDLGRNLTAPDETKQAPTTKSDAEKSIVGSSSAQKINNQSNDHAEDNSQSQNEQKLDLTKNSKKFAKKVLATNLTETKSSTNDLATQKDPSKLNPNDFADGTKWTTAGWTRTNPQYVAKKSTLTLTNYDPDKVMTPSIIGNTDTDFSLNFTIDKNQIAKNRAFLVGTIQNVFYDKKQDLNQVHSWNGGNIGTIFDGYRTSIINKNIIADGKQIGHLVFSNNNLENDIYYVSDIDKNELATSDDITVQFSSGNYRMVKNTWFDNFDWSNLSKSGYTFPIVQKIITNTKSYSLTFYPNKEYTSYERNDPSKWLMTNSNDYYQDSLFNAYGSNGWAYNDQTVTKVWKMKSSDPTATLSNVILRKFYHYIDSNNKMTDFSYDYEIQTNHPFDIIKSTDNFTASDLANDTKVNTLAYSKQNDGSFLVCMKFNTKDESVNLNDLHDAVSKSYLANVIDPEHKQQIIDNTINYYKGNHVFNSFSAFVFLLNQQNQDANKSNTVWFTDVTPDHPTGWTATNIHGTGSTDTSAELYRTTKIIYEDDDNSNSNVSNDVLIGHKNKASTYTVNIPQGYLLDTNTDGVYYTWNADHTQITYTFNEDQAKNDANPIEIHLKHKLIDVSATDPNAKQNNRYRMIENLPDGTKKTLIDLEIESHRTATKDLATGKTTYSDWISKDAVITNHTNNSSANDPSFIREVSLDWFNNCTRTFSIPNGYEKVEQNGYTLYTSPLEKDNNGSYLINFVSYPDGGVGLDFEVGISKDNVTTYKAMPASCDFVINYQHNTQKVTDPSQLQTTGKRTITISMPKGHGAQMTIIQTVGYKRTGSLDLYTGKTTYTDWVFDADTSNVTVDGQPSTQYQAYILKDGVVNYAPIKLPHINGYKTKLIQDKANPAMFMVSFFALPQQNNQSTSSKTQPSDNVQSPQKPAQAEQKQPEPAQTRPAEQEEKDKQIDQLVRTISYTLMHSNSTSDTADSFEPTQADSAPLEAPSDSTQKDDTAKHKKHIVKKHVAKRHKKHAKKYHLKRRSRKHTKRAKKRIIKHRKSVSRKFRKHNLKHVKKN